MKYLGSRSYDIVEVTSYDIVEVTRSYDIVKVTIL